MKPQVNELRLKHARKLLAVLGERRCSWWTVRELNKILNFTNYIAELRSVETQWNHVCDQEYLEVITMYNRTMVATEQPIVE